MLSLPTHSHHTYVLRIAMVWLALVWSVDCIAAPFTIATSNYPPFSYEEEGVQKGVAVDLVKAAFAQMHIEVKIVFFPLPRAVKLLKEGGIDAIFPFAKTEEREGYTSYPKEKLVEDTQTLFVRADSSITFDGNLKKMSVYSFGRQRDAINSPSFNEALLAGVFPKLDEALDQRQNVLKLLAGRVQVAIGPRLVVLFYAKDLGKLADIRELKPSIDNPLATYVGFSKRLRSKTVMDEFDKVLRKMRREGRYNRIVDLYVR